VAFAQHRRTLQLHPNAAYHDRNSTEYYGRKGPECTRRAKPKSPRKMAETSNVLVTASLTASLTHSLTHSLSLTHGLTHSLTASLTQPVQRKASTTHCTCTGSFCIPKSTGMKKSSWIFLINDPIEDVCDTPRYRCSSYVHNWTPLTTKVSFDSPTMYL